MGEVAIIIVDLAKSVFQALGVAAEGLAVFHFGIASPRFALVGFQSRPHRLPYRTNSQA